MLNCFWTECSVAFLLLSPPLELSTVPFQGQQCHSRDPSAEVLPAFSFLLFSKLRSSKSSDTKIFGHFNFRTKSSLDIKLVRNFSILMYFNYIEVPHFLDEIKMSQLSDKLMEDFFGKYITQKNTL